MIEFFNGLMTGIPENLIVLFEIGIMIIIGSLLAFIARLFKQPMIPAYIIAGIILGPLFLGLIKNTEVIMALSEIGVAFLLFFAGLELNLRKLKEVGAVSSITGIVQILLLFMAGFFISLRLGFFRIEAIYIGLVVTFSSTMIVVKLLSDRKELSTLHGRIILGILIVQDIAAILALAILTTDFSLYPILFAIGKALLFAVMAFILAKIAQPILRISARSVELILLIAISFLFLFSFASFFLGMSLVIGAFFAGVALANSDFKTEIQGSIIPLRDFFAVIFFVALGMQLVLVSKEFLLLVGILAALTLIFKPLIIMFFIKLLGYKRRTSFLSGISLAQTSEFSLIILALGLSLAHISQGLFSILVLLTIVTMSITSYIIGYDTTIFRFFSAPLNLLFKMCPKSNKFEHNNRKEKKIIVIGCHRIGSLFLDEFKDMKKEVLAIDLDPDIIRSLVKNKVDCIYGDFANSEVLEKANLEKAEVVFSTIPDFEDNQLLIKRAKEINSKLIIFATADRISDADRLYEAGADYVILPKLIAGRKCFDLIKRVLRSKRNIKDIRKEAKEYMTKVHHLLYK